MGSDDSDGETSHDRFRNNLEKQRMENEDKYTNRGDEQTVNDHEFKKYMQVQEKSKIGTQFEPFSTPQIQQDGSNEEESQIHTARDSQSDKEDQTEAVNTNIASDAEPQ
jgi:hypothetical protein